MQNISDEALINRLQNEDLQALGELYDRYQHKVFRTALAITGDPDAAADLLQDAFLRLHRFARTVDPERPLEPWLYRVTVNLAYTWLKRHNRFVRSLEEVTEWLIGGGKRGALAQQLEFDEAWQQLQQAVLSLPAAHRSVVVLYYVNDLPLHEIAEILEIPVGTVKSRLHYGRQALREQLDRMDGNVRQEMRYDFT